MTYDLFLDESGAFMKKGEHTLIGGVLIPHDSMPGPDVFSQWEKEIRISLAESGTASTDTLDRGDQLHDLYVSGGRRGNLTRTEQEKYDQLRSKEFYIFDHCSENGQIGMCSRRWIIQGRALEEYLNRLQTIHGVPIVFDNPDGIYHVDSNTTFMSIFANGLVQLYSLLREKDPDGETILYIHAASRKNMTREVEKSKLAVSPTAGEQATLEQRLYLNQIRNCVFLNGGSDLLDLKSFQDTLNSFEILEDIKNEIGKKIPNPATVICDYVCNSCLNSESHPELKEKLTLYGMQRYCVFSDSTGFTKAKTDLMAQNHDWPGYLNYIISQGFPEQATEEFFARISDAKGYNQKDCVNTIVSNLYSLVESRENMAEIAERIEMIISRCKPLDPDAYLLLKANLLIYLHALYTHMGREEKRQETISEFTSCIGHIRNLEERDMLLILFCNRQIVTDTDCFEYERAEEWFRIIQKYAENALANSDALMLDFADMAKGEEIPDAQYLQYGKAIGSYIQLLTKEIRTSNEEKKKELTTKENEIIQTAFTHFTRESDIRRCHQNICDLLTEQGQYDAAMEHLYLSCCGGGTQNFNDQAEEILNATGHYGEKANQLFIYLHYVYMMHRCIRRDDPHGKIMLDKILQVRPAEENLQHLWYRPHPEGLVCWHLGASMAALSDWKKMSYQLLDSAYKTLMTSSSQIFTVMALGIQAETLALGLEHKLSEKLADWSKEADKFLGEFFLQQCSRLDHHPFASIDTNQENIERILYRIADAVAY